MPVKSPLTRFALLRHAKTEWNLTKRIQGQEDSPLTREGEDQARNWGRILSDFQWDRIVTSDTGRAIKTAALVNLSLMIPVVSDPRLREQDWGKWTGKTMAQIEKEAPEYLKEQLAKVWSFCPPGGENRISVLERSLQALKQAHLKYTGKTILIVTHEGVIKCVISHLKEIQKPSIKHLSFLSDHLHWLTYNGKGLRLEKMNAISLVSLMIFLKRTIAKAPIRPTAVIILVPITAITIATTTVIRISDCTKDFE